MNARLPVHTSLDRTVELLNRLRQDAPLVQCLTNTVVQPITANALLALGASPAMVDLPGEAGPFAEVAGGVLLNLGTPQADQREAMLEAATAADAHGTPWVLDPVAIGSLPVRTALAARLVALRPTIVRGNPSEVLALAGLGSGGRGTDSTVSGEEALEAAVRLAGEHGSVVAVSGAVDLVTDARRTTRISTGHPWLTTITGGGCALGAVMAAFAALTDDAYAATLAAVTAYTVAAEVAAERATGPGSFAVALLDALASLDADTLRDRAMLA